MQLLKLLSEVSLLRLVIAAAASVLSGVATMAAIICVLESIRTGNAYVLAFCAIAAIAVLSRMYSRGAINQLSAKSILRLRRRLIRSIMHVPLRDLEQIGIPRLILAFTNELATIGSSVRNFVSLFSNLAFVAACLAYLGWLSPAIMVTTATLLLLCIGGAILLRRTEKDYARQFRDGWGRVVHVYKTMLDGSKELKLSRPLTFQVLRYLDERIREMQEFAKTRGVYSDAVATWVQSMFYVILGVAVFGPFGVDTHRNVGYGLLALLYLRGPLRSVIVDTAGFSEATVALQSISELGLTLVRDHERDRAQDTPDRPQKWRSLELNSVRFHYDSAHPDDDFDFGPLDITLHPGEIVFIAGGNGSGKTTLLKILTGLYPPTSGTIRYDGIPIAENNVRWYRSRFGVVFADFCLFEGIANLDPSHLSADTEKLFLRLNLQGWMLSSHESQEGTSQLSAGERRRVALLTALLDDRPIMVFDEWAADQDPQYKNIFYKEILPSLRERGKLLIVLSHDERYFNVADRVLWLERGIAPVWRSPQTFEESHVKMVDTES